MKKQILVFQVLQEDDDDFQLQIEIVQEKMEQLELF
jgi:hypothetical protein